MVTFQGFVFHFFPHSSWRFYLLECKRQRKDKGILEMVLLNSLLWQYGLGRRDLYSNQHHVVRILIVISKYRSKSSFLVWHDIVLTVLISRQLAVLIQKKMLGSTARYLLPSLQVPSSLRPEVQSIPTSTGLLMLIESAHSSLKLLSLVLHLFLPSYESLW